MLKRAHGEKVAARADMRKANCTACVAMHGQEIAGTMCNGAFGGWTTTLSKREPVLK